MDLTPKPSAPWWSIFGCCSPSSSSDVGEHEDGYGNDDKFTTAPSASALKVVNGGVVEQGKGPLPDTPVTACTESSADVSFESQDGDFTGEIFDSKKQVTSVSPRGLDDTRVEEEDGFIGEVAVFTPRYANNSTNNGAFSLDKESTRMGDHSEEGGDFAADEEMMSDPDEENYWSSDLDENASPLRRFVSRRAQHTTEDQMEIKFYQFMLLMMLRHIFGYWLPGEYDPTTNLFNTRLMLTQGSHSEKKEFQNMMNDECEVVPRLRREEGSLNDMPGIDE